MHAYPVDTQIFSQRLSYWLKFVQVCRRMRGSCYFIFLTENPLRSGDHGHPKVSPSFEPCQKISK